MAKFRTRLIEFIEYCFLRILCALINLIPFPQALAMGKLGGRLLYYFIPRYRAIAAENLRNAFGSEKSPRELKRIALGAFENLGLFAIEFIRIPKTLGQLDRFIRFENVEPLYRPLEAGKGEVLIVSHFGNWEWMAVVSGAEVASRGHTINAVARKLGNPWMYRYITKLRGSTGLRTVDKKGAVREVMKLLGENQIVCILIDQHERHGSVRVPFFGRMAETTSLPAMLAVKKGIPVVPVFCYRRRNGPSILNVGEPFACIRTGDYERDLYENTKQYVEAIEREVRKQPSNWLWMHRRWR